VEEEVYTKNTINKKYKSDVIGISFQAIPMSYLFLLHTIINIIVVAVIIYSFFFIIVMCGGVSTINFRNYNFFFSKSF